MLSEIRGLARQLGFKTGHYVDARYSIDIPNIKYIPRFMAHPHTGLEFFGLAFLILRNIHTPADIPRTLIFCDTIDLGSRVIYFLDRLLSQELHRCQEVIKPYSSLMTSEYRKDFLNNIRVGSIVRIGVCTDTCTNGLDVPCIRRAVNYSPICKLYDTLKQ